MAKREAPLSQLADFLPEGCAEDVLYFLEFYKVQLTIKRARRTVLGDYRHAQAGQPHRISINGNLNEYAFLITLLHELAHLLNFEKYGNRVLPHGNEWKAAFSDILARFLMRKAFPPDIAEALHKTIRNPSAASCSDAGLLRVLHRYDQKGPDICLVENIGVNCLFRIAGGRVFRKGDKVRTRFLCTEIETGRRYLFSGVHEVRMLTELV